MGHEHPGPVRRLGMRAFRAAPSRLVWPAIRVASPTYTVGAVALIVYDDKLLALHQTHRKGVSLPGGLIEKNEQPAGAVAREVLEETGLRIDPGDVVATVFETKLRHIDVLFRVVCDREPVVEPASEATAYEWLPLDGWTDIDRSTERILRALHAVRHAPRQGRILPASGSGG